ncbi:hypothetical protein FB446DRAFT_630835, partial [Lentinula raphanica]
KGIRARLYPAQGPSPQSTVAYYKENRPRYGRRRPFQNRFVFASDLLSDARLQPFVHDVVVSVQFGGQTRKFRVFFKRHVRLPLNQTLQNIGVHGFEGDVLVVAFGKQAPARNLRGWMENRAADEAIKKLATKIGPVRNRSHFPRAVSFN